MLVGSFEVAITSPVKGSQIVVKLTLEESIGGFWWLLNSNSMFLNLLVLNAPVGWYLYGSVVKEKL